jgi:hypothetical protein
MKALWCGATALGLVTAVSLSPAMAQRPKPSGGNTWPDISQRVVPSSLSAATTNTHYEWRSGYVAANQNSFLFGLLPKVLS